MVDNVSFPIVGIGASAGGLAAFKAFFSGMPANKNPDMAFVLVQHLSPDHKSILVELIQRHTALQVFEATHGVVVQPNCIYVIPPNYDMALEKDKLQLIQPALAHGQRRPIDFFFRSMAVNLGEKAICIVLSGSGNDGTHGVVAVKSAGGMVMAQTGDSAAYHDMPNNAVATGSVDYVMLPEDMPKKIINYVSQVFNDGFGQLETNTQLALKSDDLIKIFIMLRKQTGHDFSQYKRNTIERRVERRIGIHKISGHSDYVHFLQQNPAEVNALFCDLLIGVTSCFRDAKAFDALEKEVIPNLFKDKSSEVAIRIWICGCSTGEEAYSVAILLHEHMTLLKKDYKLQVFATDIDRNAIDKARKGVYSSAIIADISPERLERFFTLEPNGIDFRINKTIRDTVVFSEQDLLKDPPFSKLNLITCRNLLIYLNSNLQKKIIPLFHYALKPSGFLFLGSSETVGDFSHLFSTIDRQAKLYRRKDDFSNTNLSMVELPISGMLSVKQKSQIVKRQCGVDAKMSFRETTERMLLEKYAPLSVLINATGEILYVHGSTGNYLQMSSGEPNINILNMACEGLKREIATALYSAIKYETPVLRQRVEIKNKGVVGSAVNLTILPVPPPVNSAAVILYLVVLEEALLLEKKAPEMPVSKEILEANNYTNNAELVVSLSQKLLVCEEYLQTTKEELETSNEELKSSNEEMQSVNEELQSTNEELETSKEELQSINEELTTVNVELQTKVLDLSRVNNDMNNLLAGTGIGTVFVDFNLIIQRFTPSITQVINLISSDVGRPVGHIVSNLVGYNSLVEDVERVQKTLIPYEVEVQSTLGNWFLLRIRPYRTLENVIEGAVITFFDINDIKRAKQANTLLNRLAVVLMDAHDAIIMQDLEGHILNWNPAACKAYGYTEAEALQMNISEIIPQELRELELKRINDLSRNEKLQPYKTQRLIKNGAIVDIWLTATAMLNEDKKVYAIITIERTTRMETPL